MKRERIYGLFKKRHHLKLYNKTYTDTDGEEKIAMQYISDGYAIYALENLPVFDNETIFGLLGVDPVDNLHCTVDYIPPWFVNALADYDDSDVPLEKVTNIFGYTFLITYRQKFDYDLPEMSCFIDPSYLSPLSDEDYTLYSRKINGMYMVIVKAGLITKAVIMPKNFSGGLESSELDKKIDWLKKAQTALILMKQEMPTEDEESQIKMLEG